MSAFDISNAKLAKCLHSMSQGDRKAFEELYKITAPKLNAIILSMIKDEALTFDILQQAYLSVWRNAGSFDPKKGKAFTWILVITRNKALDLMRKRKRFSTTEQLSETLEDEKMQSDMSAKRLLLRRLIAPHLQALTANTRDAVVLSAVYGLTSKEIGVKIGVPTNTAKSWVRRGLSKLKKDLGVEDIKTLL
ncbi:RNA polymerase sigma-70 factor (ECF subfamily) [Litorimonas taeanensis]|uniref:RNA polymerase sigma-70 factor (ECF subfamily) n=1 Tax=Litorimonas taeanensis TaxID=568099 RepID=A0A420WF91_9PROT|nr:sigma-70 family RNA polymerase sigma factor [Litorimonas taeanensis]RKQ69651.1 RNA polymerase sigma-70 factor (ECF subfamily) [Litorimonas taeanensis]